MERLKCLGFTEDECDDVMVLTSKGETSLANWHHFATDEALEKTLRKQLKSIIAGKKLAAPTDVHIDIEIQFELELDFYLDSVTGNTQCKVFSQCRDWCFTRGCF